MTDVRFPAMRAEVVEAVRALADPEYQWRVWVRHEFPQPNFYDDFTLNIHMLYDDTTVFEDPTAAVGDILRNREEAQALEPLKHALDTLFDRHGTQRTDEEYLTTPEWAAVVEAAREALTALTAPGG